jgi:hypothetical protein
MSAKADSPSSGPPGPHAALAGRIGPYLLSFATSPPASRTPAWKRTHFVLNREGGRNGQATKDVCGVPTPTPRTDGDGGSFGRRLRCRLGSSAPAAGTVSGETANVERARAILDDLIRQRQRMRDARVEEGLLEANRLGIVYWQGQVARASADERERSEATA